MPKLIVKSSAHAEVPFKSLRKREVTITGFQDRLFLTYGIEIRPRHHEPKVVRKDSRSSKHPSGDFLQLLVEHVVNTQQQWLLVRIWKRALCFLKFCDSF